MFWSMDKTVKDVKDMYNYTKTNQTPLLSDFSSSAEIVFPYSEDYPSLSTDFWKEYTDNYEEYDKIFYRTYKSYRYFNQEVDEDNDIDDVTEDFIDAVRGHLMMNDIKYTRLYISYINPLHIDPSDDYEIRRTNARTRTEDEEYESGSRSDSASETLGSYETNVDDYTAQREDLDTSTYGQRTDTVSATVGARTTTNQIGTRGGSTTSQTKAFNSTSWVDISKTQTTSDSATDTSSTGSATDSSSNVKGSETDTVRMNHGAVNREIDSYYSQRQNSSSFSKGRQTDTRDLDETVNDNGSESGNYKNKSENMKKYDSYWSSRDFYKYIFKEIAKDLLLV